MLSALWTDVAIAVCLMILHMCGIAEETEIIICTVIYTADNIMVCHAGVPVKSCPSKNESAYCIDVFQNGQVCAPSHSMYL